MNIPALRPMREPFSHKNLDLITVLPSRMSVDTVPEVTEGEASDIKGEKRKACKGKRVCYSARGIVL